MALNSEDEARRLLGGLGRTTFYKLLGTGELRSVKIGRRRFVSDEAIAEYIDRLERSESPIR